METKNKKEAILVPVLQAGDYIVIRLSKDNVLCYRKDDNYEVKDPQKIWPILERAYEPIKELEKRNETLEKILGSLSGAEIGEIKIGERSANYGLVYLAEDRNRPLDKGLITGFVYEKGKLQTIEIPVEKGEFNRTNDSLVDELADDTLSKYIENLPALNVDLEDGKNGMVEGYALNKEELPVYVSVQVQNGKLNTDQLNEYPQEVREKIVQLYSEKIKNSEKIKTQKPGLRAKILRLGGGLYGRKHN